MFETVKDKNELLRRAKEITVEAMEGDHDWQRDAVEDFAFRNNDQWPKAEKEQLELDRRPALTFNVTKASIDLVKGLNEDIKIRYRANPVKQSDGFACEVINKLVYWAQEANEWEEVEDEAFESAAICGRGWVGIDFGPDPKRYGQIRLDQFSVPVHEVFIDPASREKDLSDASFIVWDKWLTLEDFKVKYPDSKIDVDQVFDLGVIPVTLGVQPEPLADPDPIADTDISDYDVNLDDTYYDRNKRMIRLIHMEYWKTCRVEWVLNPETREWSKLEDMGLDKKQWTAWFTKNYPHIDIKQACTTLMDKKVHWLQFVAHEILYDDVAPVPYDGFSVVPCIAYSDVSKRTQDHFGVVRLMKDAQREINKRWSQTLNLINNQVQPGLYAEIDAFLDKEQAEDSMKTPGDITYLEPGSIAKKKIMERSVPQFPNATFNLEEQAQVMLRRITGINPDLLGQDRGRQEPGVVVKMRQQQGLIILRPLFQAYKKMKRELFKRQVAIILKWMPVTQMRRILGNRFVCDINKQGQTVITSADGTMGVNLDNIRQIDYTVDLEETSASMTQRMFELSAMTEMQNAGIPADPIVMIQKMDLPETDKLHWIQYVTNMQEQQAQTASAELEMEQAKLKMQHQREMLKIIFEHQAKTDKTMAQMAKDAANIKATFKELGIESTDVMLDFIAKMANVQQNREEAVIDSATSIKVAEEQAKKVQKEQSKMGGTNDGKTGRDS